ncbi:hypothetical protein [Actinopolyspora saharensis]|uniref:hypothetical protein n=1 Tax=Actinopolyspora saharensis TaxID=995062 RepID=UPI0011146A79|nr:hypothetical protein [Actinopolyspora saharensis]
MNSVPNWLRSRLVMFVCLVTLMAASEQRAGVEPPGRCRGAAGRCLLQAAQSVEDAAHQLRPGALIGCGNLEGLPW